MSKRKKKLPAPLSAAQREIMDLVWQHGEVPVAQVWEILAARRDVARNTVQTMLVRMEEKGWLKHRSIGRTFVYQAAQPRRASLSGAVQNLVDTVFGGSAEELVTALFADRKLTKKEADRIRAMIDQAEGRQERRKS